jgi:predicted small lipoprotein YifL
MKKIAQLALMVVVAVAISACGKIGELEPIKTQQVTPTQTLQSSTIT